MIVFDCMKNSAVRNKQYKANPFEFLRGWPDNIPFYQNVPEIKISKVSTS